MRWLIVLVSASVLAAGTAPPDLPLGFERERTGSAFYTHTSIRLSTREISVAGSRASLRLSLPGARPVAPEPLDPLPGAASYFVGKDPAEWRSGVSIYSRILYSQLYPGIDLVCHGTNRSFEYDFELQPGADPSRIRMAFDSGYAAHIDGDGSLVLSGPGGVWRHHPPRVSQGGKIIRARYRIGHNDYGFQLGAYDRSQPLLIDPVITQVTYIGGTRVDFITAMALDSSGNIYLTGQTNSTDFPVTGGAYQSQYTGGPCPVSVEMEPPQGGPPVYEQVNTWCPNAFVLKLDPSATKLIYATYVGGSGGDRPHTIVVNPEGNVWVAGETSSTDFPLSTGAIQQSNTGSSEFLFELDTAGSRLIYSTYLGTNNFDTFTHDQITGLAVSPAGYLYVAGTTTDSHFPVRQALQSTFDKGDCNSLYFFNGGGPICSSGFLMQFHLPDMALQYSTYLGGSSDDAINGIAADAAGNVYVAGFTLSTDFPLVHPIQSEPGGGPCLVSDTIAAPACSDAFVTKINAAGTQILYSTLLGGAGTDAAIAIAVDANGYAYVTGYTDAVNFPLANAFQNQPGGGICYTPHGGPVPCDNLFLSKINTQGTALVFSTYLGGAGENDATAMGLDSSGNVYVGGTTTAYAGFATTANALLHCGGAGQFLTEWSPTGGLIYSTYLDVSPVALAVGAPGHVYLAGDGLLNVTSAANAAQTIIGAQSGFVTLLNLNETTGSTGPHIDPGCILDAADYVPSVGAPGEIVSIIGSGLGPAQGVSAALTPQNTFPTSVAGVSVTFNGIAAPLLYVSANQINAVVPFAAGDANIPTVQVTFQNSQSPPFTGIAYGGGDGIFTLGSTGAGQAAALNQDGTLNSPSNPAARGSTVSIWATGLGPTTPAYPDGEITPLAQAPLVRQPVVYVYNAAITAQVTYAGQAPGLVAGAAQINFVVPENAPPGPAIPISFFQILARNAYQNPTIAIK